MAFALDLQVPARVEPPALVAPGPREVSFGRVTGRVGPGTHRVVVLVGNERAGVARIRGSRFELRVDMPPRDVAIQVVAEDALGNSAAARVGPVIGLPAEAHGGGRPPHEDAELARAVGDLAEGFPGIAAVYVENLRSGAGAAWNARARFPAASTVKVAIGIEVMRRLEERPLPGTDLDVLLRDMLVDSDNASANALLTWLGGSETGGAAVVNESLRAIGVGETELFGGYLTGSGEGRPIPLEATSEPSFAGKYTTAYDLAQIFRALHRATAGRGPLAGRGLTPADARFLLYVLAHSADRGKLDRYVTDDAIVPHKGGWVSEARHDSGLVYSRAGVFVVSVMTWTGGDAGEPSDELAGRVARAALDRFRRAAAEGDADSSPDA